MENNPFRLESVPQSQRQREEVRASFMEPLPMSPSPLNRMARSPMSYKTNEMEIEKGGTRRRRTRTHRRRKRKTRNQRRRKRTSG